MKKLLVFAAVLIFSNEMMAQKVAHKDVPRYIITAFAEKFPDGKVQKWELKKEGYTARFNHGGKDLLAYYSHDGKWQGTESKIKWTKHLPENVKKGWASSGHYNWYVNGIRSLQTPERQLYVLHINNGSTLDSDHYDAYKESRVLFFTADGQLVRTDKI